MGNLYLSSDYKNTIISLLIKNENFVKLINPQPSKCSKIKIKDVLLGGTWIYDDVKYEEQGHVFDYNFVDETTTDEKTFVFVETDIDTVRQNMFTDFNLYICIFSAKSLVRITNDTVPSLTDIAEMGYKISDHGNRIDILCDVVDGILNGNKKIKGIGDVEPASRGYVTMYCPNSKYYGKCLKYKISNLNMGGDSCEN